MRGRLGCVAVLAGGLLGGVGAEARAQGPEGSVKQPGPRDPNLAVGATADWIVGVEASAWYTGPAGELRMPGQPGSAEQGRTRLEDINLDSPRLSPLLRIEARDRDTGDWRFGLSGAYFSAEDSGWTATEPGRLGTLTYAAGDRVRSSFSYFTAEGVVGRRVPIGPELEGKPGSAVRVRLEVVGGLRFDHYDFRFEGEGGSSASASEFFARPVVGVQLGADLARRFGVNLKLDVGGLPLGNGRSAFGGDVMVGFQYRPWDNVGVQLGYRILINRVKSEDGPEAFEFRGSMAGLFTGLVVRF